MGWSPGDRKLVSVGGENRRFPYFLRLSPLPPFCDTPLSPTIAPFLSLPLFATQLSSSSLSLLSAGEEEEGEKSPKESAKNGWGGWRREIDPTKQTFFQYKNYLPIILIGRSKKTTTDELFDKKFGWVVNDAGIFLPARPVLSKSARLLSRLDSFPVALQAQKRLSN